MQLVSCCASPGDSQVEKESSIAPAVLSAPFIITLSGVVLSSSALGFIDPVLSPYMQDTYGVDTGLSGVFFMVPGECTLNASTHSLTTGLTPEWKH